MALRPARCLGAGRRLASASYVRFQTQANSISARRRNRGSEDGTNSWWSALGGAQQNLCPLTQPHAVPCVSLGSFDQSWELTICECVERLMGNPLSTEECQKVAAEFSDRAKSASSAFLRRYYQRVVKRYLLLAEGELRSAERDSVSASIAAIEAGGGPQGKSS